MIRYLTIICSFMVRCKISTMNIVCENFPEAHCDSIIPLSIRFWTYPTTKTTCVYLPSGQQFTNFKRRKAKCDMVQRRPVARIDCLGGRFLFLLYLWNEFVWVQANLGEHNKLGTAPECPPSLLASHKSVRLVRLCYVWWHYSNGETTIIIIIIVSRARRPSACRALSQPDSREPAIYHGPARGVQLRLDRGRTG